jgi:DNA repair protein RadC
MTKVRTPHFYGHRKRVKKKFLNMESTTNFEDYELIELTLFHAAPRKDVKPLAKNLLEKFKNISNLINADKEKLLEVNGSNENVYLLFKLIKEITKRALKEDITQKNVLSSWNELINYLKIAMGNDNVEQFRILFLNKKNVLIADDVLTKGTIDQTPIYPREVVKKALFYGASAIILVHNHPSGNPKPSAADIEMTQKVIAVCDAVNVVVHDHVIVCKDDFFSFKTNSLI